MTPELSSAGINGVKERGPDPQGTTCREGARREGHDQAANRKGPWVLGKARPFLFLYLPRDLF